MSKELINAWKFTTFVDTPLVQDTITALEAADKEIALTEQHLADAMSVINKQGHEIATLKAQVAAFEKLEDENRFKNAAAVALHILETAFNDSVRQFNDVLEATPQAAGEKK